MLMFLLMSLFFVWFFFSQGCGHCFLQPCSTSRLAHKGSVLRRTPCSEAPVRTCLTSRTDSKARQGGGCRVQYIMSVIPVFFRVAQL